jgi:hypothetical protein
MVINSSKGKQAQARSQQKVPNSHSKNTRGPEMKA